MSALYNVFKQQTMSGSHDLSNGGHAIKVALVLSSHTVAVGDTNYAGAGNPGADELAGTATDATLAGQSVSSSGVFDANPLTGVNAIDSPDSGQTVGFLVLYNTDASFSAANDLICYIDSGTGLGTGGGGLSTSGNPVDITWNASGIFTL